MTSDLFDRIMKIGVINLQVVSDYEIEIDIDTEFIFGVETAAPIFCKKIGTANIEHVAVLCLDNTNKIINYSDVSIGEIDSVKVSIAQLLKVALLSNASKLIIAHNHPSGVLDITSCDIDMTKKIGVLLKYFNIELIDSLVVNGKYAISIRERIGE